MAVTAVLFAIGVDIHRLRRGRTIRAGWYGSPPAMVEHSSKSSAPAVLRVSSAIEETNRRPSDGSTAEPVLSHRNLELGSLQP
jgi:hypothetical protein